MTDNKKTWGVLAQFEDAPGLLRAAAGLHNAGYRRFECHSPFPIHGIEEATKEPRSRLGYIAAAMALIGGLSAISLMGWASAVDYPLVISGKPFFSYQAFVPITFALAVLFAAVGTLMGMIGLIRLRFQHPVFDSDRFRQFSDDGFFVSIQASDPNFDLERTQSLLASLGGNHIEVLTE